MIHVLAQQAAGTAGNGGDEAFLWWGVILLGVALVLLALELLIPSGGLIGLVAGIAVIGSVVAFWQYDPAFGLAATGLYIVLGPAVLVFIFKVWINSPLARKVILVNKDERIGATDDENLAESELARRERAHQLEQLIGAEGRTVSACRPVGTVIIGGERIEALAETGIIEAGTPVVVTAVYDNQIKIRPA